TLALLVPAPTDLSAPVTLAGRIAAGVAISALSLLVIALLIRKGDGKRMRDAGLTSIRSGWRLVLWGALVWFVPAGATFGVLAILGAPLTVAVPASELALTVVLLLAA